MADEKVTLRFESSDNDDMIHSEPFNVWKVFDYTTELYLETFEDVPIEERDGLIVFVRKRYEDNIPFKKKINGTWRWCIPERTDITLPNDFLEELQNDTKFFYFKNISTFSDARALSYFESSDPSNNYWKLEINENPESNAVQDIKDHIKIEDGSCFFYSPYYTLRYFDDNGSFYRWTNLENGKGYWEEIYIGSHSHRNKALLDEISSSISISELSETPERKRIPVLSYNEENNNFLIKWEFLDEIKEEKEEESEVEDSGLKLPSNDVLLTGHSYDLKMNDQGELYWVESTPVVEISENSFKFFTIVPDKHDGFTIDTEENFNIDDVELLIMSGRYFIPRTAFELSKEENIINVSIIDSDYYFYDPDDESPVIDTITVVYLKDLKNDLTAYFDERYLQLTELTDRVKLDLSSYVKVSDFNHIIEEVKNIVESRTKAEWLRNELEGILQRYRYNFADRAHTHDNQYAPLVHIHDERYISRDEIEYLEEVLEKVQNLDIATEILDKVESAIENVVKKLTYDKHSIDSKIVALKSYMYTTLKNDLIDFIHNESIDSVKTVSSLPVENIDSSIFYEVPNHVLTLNGETYKNSTKEDGFKFFYMDGEEPHEATIVTESEEKFFIYFSIRSKASYVYLSDGFAEKLGLNPGKNNMNLLLNNTNLKYPYTGAVSYIKQLTTGFQIFHQYDLYKYDGAWRWIQTEEKKYNALGSISSKHPDTKASADFSNSLGIGTQSSEKGQTVVGKYNEISEDKAFVVGNGEKNKPSNAHTIDWSGNAFYKGSVEVGSIVLRSSVDGSEKKFEITVDDSGKLNGIDIPDGENTGSNVSGIVFAGMNMSYEDGVFVISKEDALNALEIYTKDTLPEGADESQMVVTHEHLEDVLEDFINRENLEDAIDDAIKDIEITTDYGEL